ncbi:flagellin N-terminal helical domain-containing protein [Methylorubrum extorquens]
MTSLSTNIAAMTALGTLKGITAQLATTGNRLATGQRIAAASDGAAYWSIATAIRTDNASLRALGDTLGLGAAAFDVAYAGLDSVLSDLRSLRATLQTALAPGIDRAKVQTEVAAIQNRMRATADTSVSAGRNWLSVDSASATYRPREDIVAGLSRGPSGAVTFSTFPVEVEVLKLYDASPTVIRAAPTPASLSGDIPMAMTSAFGGRGRADFTTTPEVGFRLSTGSGSDVIRLNAVNLASRVRDMSAVTPAELTKAINAEIALSPTLSGHVTASLMADGRLSFATMATGASASLILHHLVPSPGYTTADLAIVSVDRRQSFSPLAFAPDLYRNVDLSGSNTKSITLGDGTASVTYTFGASSRPPPADRTSVTFDEMSAMFVHERRRVDADFWMNIGGGAGGHVFVATGRAEGPSAVVTVSGPDVAAFGFTPGQSAVGSEYVQYGMPRSASGRDGIQTASTRGLLDTPGASGYAVATLDVSGLSGASGAATLQAVIRDVETVIARATDTGARLGAGKLLVEGQRMFLDALVKTNERTIGALVDADIETEATRLKALQAQRDLAAQALNIANAAPQAILTLFQS